MTDDLFNLSWWQYNTDTKDGMDRFRVWCGDYKKPFKKRIRKYIAEKGYKSVLDCGSGLCSEYYGFKNDGYEIDYYALDITPRFVEICKSNGIEAILGDTKSIPFGNNFADVCICLDVLNHQSGYREHIDEMLRVARKEVIISFFLPFVEKAFTKENEREPGVFYHYFNRDEIISCLGDREHRFEKFEDRELLFIEK